MEIEIFAIIITAIVATGAVFALRVYVKIVKEKTKAARAVEEEKTTPQSALKDFMALVNNAPTAYLNQKQILDAEKKKNPEGDHSELEFQVKMLGTLAKYQYPIRLAAPIIGPAVIKRFRGLVGGG